MKRIWSIAVVYGDAEDRAQAVKVCDHLVERFWTQCEFSVSWCSCAMLEKPDLALEAVRKAAQSDLLIFTLAAEKELPMSVQSWMESWLEHRGEREGALVDLVAGASEPERSIGRTHAYLREMAHRGGMDYLTQEPETLCWAFPDSAESCTNRAHRVTSVLDEILRSQRVPTQLSQL